jgi:hypothetical protein
MTRSKDPLDEATGAVRGASDLYVQMAFHLPKFYLRVLDGEAAYLAGQRRAQILELLVLRKAGLLRVERSPSAPRYQIRRGELDELERYLWHCRREVKEHLDRLLERMGKIPPRAWVMLALNEWIGMPAGMGDLDEEEPTELAIRAKPPEAPARRKPHIVRRPTR